MKIEQIKIAGLFAKYDANLTVRDNTIILVGANGLGKSTILNIVHYTLTKQWDLLPTLPFRSVTIEINGRELTLHADYLRSSSIFSANQEDLQSRSPQRFRANLHSLLSYSPELLEALLKIDDSDQFVQTFRGLSRTLNIEDLYETWSFLAVPQNKRIVESLIEPGPISTAIKVLEPLQPYRFMYLPTYRRIEKTLQDLFPDIDEAVQRRTRNASRSKSPLVEFVQFGMGDVRELFENKIRQLRLHSNRVLSSTSGSYLRDVIRGQGSDYDEERIYSLDDSTILNALHRYEGQFTDADVAALLMVPKTVRSGGQLTSDQKLIAHYLIRLIEAMENIATVERPLREFADIASQYFYDKTVRYSDIEGSLTIRSNDGDAEINLKDLSSGEKQIASLLSHIYLEEKETLLFIDEPELSLSVDWQTRLLPDLRKSGRCAFLLAVTHSPFIFENPLAEYAVDLRSAIGG